jgi:hypothetical protein
MKIIKINHERCNEYEKSTYLVDLFDLTEEQINKDIEDSQTEFLKAKYDNSNLGEPPEHLYINSDNLNYFPIDMTIGQLKEKIETRNQEFDEYYKKNRALERPFSFYMQKRGYKTLSELGESSTIFIKILNWDHRHGMVLDYE